MRTEQKVAVGPAHAGEPAGAPGTRTDAAPKQEIRLERLTPEYWRVTLDNPPFNIFGPQTIPQLNSVITQIETDPKVKVVVFQSAVPGFFLTHYDFVSPLSATTGISPGATGLPALPDMLVRLSRAPVVSIVSIRGRATGVGSELSLASDMRFASRETALLSQWEIGAGLVPGGGPMARLPRLIGRGRALEVLLGGEDIPGDLGGALWLRQPRAARRRAGPLRGRASVDHLMIGDLIVGVRLVKGCAAELLQLGFLRGRLFD
jgi:hypothetical protein